MTLGASRAPFFGPASGINAGRVLTTPPASFAISDEPRAEAGRGPVLFAPPAAAAGTFAAAAAEAATGATDLNLNPLPDPAVTLGVNLAPLEPDFDPPTAMSGINAGREFTSPVAILASAGELRAADVGREPAAFAAVGEAATAGDAAEEPNVDERNLGELSAGAGADAAFAAGGAKTFETTTAASFATALVASRVDLEGGATSALTGGFAATGASFEGDAFIAESGCCETTGAAFETSAFTAETDGLATTGAAAAEAPNDDTRGRRGSLGLSTSFLAEGAGFFDMAATFFADGSEGGLLF